MSANEIFQPFERLIKISVCGIIYEVPESNCLLRCFQFLEIERISAGDFCWNGDCANCQIWLENNDGTTAKPVLACRTTVAENMKIARLSDEINAALK